MSKMISWDGFGAASFGLLCLLFIATPFNSAKALESPKESSYLRPGARLTKAAASTNPYVTIAVHNINNVNITVTNIGQFGLGYLGAQTDPLTGLAAPSCCSRRF